MEAFWNSISHVPAPQRGNELALGPKEMRPLIEELAAHRPDLHQRSSQRRPTRPAASYRFPRDSRLAGTTTSRLGCQRLAEHRRWLLRDDPRAHSRTSPRASANLRPVSRPAIPEYTRLAGLEPLTHPSREQLHDDRRAD